MEISLREWLVIGGVVVIALIIFDGWRRVRGGRNSLRMDIDRRARDLPDEAENEQQSNPELPYGGARRAGAEAEAKPRHTATAASARKAPAPEAERIEPTFAGESDNAAATFSFGPAETAGADPEVGSLSPGRFDSRDYLDDFDDDIDDDLGKPRIAAAPAAVAPVAAPQAATGLTTQSTAEPEPEPVPRTAETRMTAEESLPEQDLRLQSQSEAPRGPFARKPLDEVDPLFDEIPEEYPPHPSEAQQPHTPETAQPEAGVPRHDSAAEAAPFDLEKPVPMLMERARKPRETTPEEQSPVEQSEMPLGPVPEMEQEPQPRSRPVRATRPVAGETPQQDSLFGEPEKKDPPKAADDHFELPDPEHMLLITVVATNAEGFPGATMKRILEACDLHLGSMNLFHRHEDGSASGPVQFSMANAVDPGTFDPATIETVHTPGVTFFMSMAQPRDVMNAFECMLATAETLARHLNGDLLDENRSVLRPQTKEHYRQRIRDFEMHNRSRRSVSRA
ncbi:MAG: cell division protein ZipA [Oceanospirillaceae bacterium]|nr:cell division protein ZipA [Oceanospirillaceae bacterium]